MTWPGPEQVQAALRSPSRTPSAALAGPIAPPGLAKRWVPFTPVDNHTQLRRPPRLISAAMAGSLPPPGLMQFTGWASFSPADNSGFALTSANLAASGAAGHVLAVKGTDRKTAGKYYVEIAITALGSGSTGSTGVGIAQAGADGAGLASGAANGAILFANGTAIVNGVSAASTTAALASGNTVGIALDIGNQAVWFRIGGGNWNNSGGANPATNTGGISIASLVGGLVVAAINTASNTGFSVALDAGATAFLHVPPSGFGGWTHNIYPGTDLGITKMLGAAFLAPPGDLAIRKFTAFAFLYFMPVIAMPPVYPALIGLTFDIIKRPIWSTGVAKAGSGREIRVGYYTVNLWEFELKYDFLPDQVGGTTANDLKALEGFFLNSAVSGGLGGFLFDDPDDDSVTAQAIGTADGTSTTWLIGRNFASGTIFEPVGYVNTGATLHVYLDGVLQGAGTYSIVTTTPMNQQIQFNSPPTVGKVITMTFSYWFYVRFQDDKLDFQKFMQKLWQQDKIVLESLRG